MRDVTVMGGGVFGLAVAYACARRGARVTVHEARRIGAGASGGVVGALAPHVPEAWTPIKALQLEALAMAPDWWAGVAQAGGADPGYARVGRLQPLADAEAVARAEARGPGAAELWAGLGRWAVIDGAAAPGLRIASPSGRVVHDTLSARLHPRQACAALAAAVRALGGRIDEGTPHPPQTGPVVWATGWEGLSQAGIGGPVKGQAMILEHDAVGSPIVCDAGLFIVPHADGTVAVGSTSERDFTDATATDAQLEAVHARAVALCPDLAGARVRARWAGLRPRAASRQPVLGRWPGAPDRFVANGGFKIGFALAPLAGERMADLVLDGHADIPEAFAPPAPT
ncbi:NAD(P)/FAD-dependent oxidoreductase [Rhodobaculum claviforme]|uniref:FAD-dependent oxidoreductase n=1 Tax=Rhodobaculum claviforme TaxID=1549854 RepID=A0A934TJX4_9RHOB|nr:FAD-binding oxidoreductase [Rhodobaculum claviforme]MBK5927469.1 FAD-dependent oxidoreductase [Rhodobaculum claviforme]